MTTHTFGKSLVSTSCVESVVAPPGVRRRIIHGRGIKLWRDPGTRFVLSNPDQCLAAICTDGGIHASCPFVEHVLRKERVISYLEHIMRSSISHLRIVV